MNILWQLFLIILISTSAYAENDQIANEIVDNISHEFVDCACYFSIVAQGIRNSGDKTLAAKYDEASDTAMKYAVIAAEKSRITEMAQKVTLARFELGLKSMIKEIENDVSNLSILTNKYAFPCKTAIETPEAMMKEWENKVIDKHYKTKK
ncbi:MAG: hypothetical protein RDU59_11170 [Thermodesulfobacteriota bacterium]|nr:hypothetical protein [Thermodesulfobacteriota bacterium]